MKLRSFLFIVSFVICCNAQGQSKKVLENQMNDLFQAYERLATKIGMLEENYVKLNTKVVILEEKLKFAEKEIQDLNSEMFEIKSKGNTNNSKKPIIENSEESNIQKSQPKSKPTQSSGQCQATTKKGSRCSRMAQSGRSYCYQH